MCMVSVIGDHFQGTIPKPYQPDPFAWIQTITRAEFDTLKNEVAELKKLLMAAKAYDAATGQPDCEMGEKIDLLRKVAKAVGVDLDDVLKEKT